MGSQSRRPWARACLRVLCVRHLGTLCLRAWPASPRRAGPEAWLTGGSGLAPSLLSLAGPAGTRHVAVSCAGRS